MKKYIQLILTELLIILVMIQIFLYFSKENYIDELQNKSNSNSHILNFHELLNLPQRDSSVLIINVWESWCVPCIKEIPELNKIKQKYSDKKVLFVALTSSKKMDCEKSLSGKNQSFDYIQIYECKNIIDKIDSAFLSGVEKKMGVPQHIIVSKKGEIIELLEGSSSINLYKIKLYLDNYAEEKRSNY